MISSRSDRPVHLWILRGGSDGKNVSQTVENYVSAMEEKDAAAAKAAAKASAQGSDESRGSDVATKSKKSNAVGDPGDDSSDDDEEDEEDIHDIEESEEGENDPDTTERSEETVDDDMSEWEKMEGEGTSLRVEFEVVEEVEDEDDDSPPVSRRSGSSGGGGVGVRLGRRRNKRKKVQSAVAQTSQPLVDAWMSHIYLPPTAAALAHLSKCSRSIDADGKSRLDRRTLYGGLLQEFMEGSSTRKFVAAQTTQQLKAALSMATQPNWREAFPQNAAVMLYDQDYKLGPTLSMQETVAMALVSTLCKSSQSSVHPGLCFRPLLLSCGCLQRHQSPSLVCFVGIRPSHWIFVFLNCCLLIDTTFQHQTGTLVGLWFLGIGRRGPLGRPTTPHEERQSLG